MTTHIDRLLFGDNQFFGVNHMSEEKARQQLDRFKDTSAIMEVLDIAYDLGIRTFMCTTHDRIGEVADRIRARRDRYKDFLFFPGMPYAHKYANSVSQVGVMKTLKTFSSGSILSTLYLGALGTATRDVSRLMRLLVDAEMKRFDGLPTPVIFIQNVVTDLLLGLGLHDLFAEFGEHVKRRYGAEPGFFTMNAPALVDALGRVGIEKPIICANFNKIAFRMSGGIEAYERLVQQGRCRMIAMSVFASGAIPPEEALDYVCRQPGIESIVFGASSRKNIEGTRALVDRLDAAFRAGAPARAAG